MPMNVIDPTRAPRLYAVAAVTVSAILLASCSTSTLCSPDGACSAGDASLPPCIGDAGATLSDAASTGACEGWVSFGDADVEAAVRTALGIAESRSVHACELAALEALTVAAADGPIDSIVGLECATSLATLSLEGGTLSDLSPLTGLSALRSIRIRDCDVEDVSPIASLSNVRALNLGGNEISDLGPLEDPSWIDLDALCIVVDFDGNPLDAPSIADTLPSFCDLNPSGGITVFWTGGSCQGDTICDPL